MRERKVHFIVPPGRTACGRVSTVPDSLVPGLVTCWVCKATQAWRDSLGSGSDEMVHYSIERDEPSAACRGRGATILTEKWELVTCPSCKQWRAAFDIEAQVEDLTVGVADLDWRIKKLESSLKEKTTIQDVPTRRALVTPRVSVVASDSLFVPLRSDDQGRLVDVVMLWSDLLLTYDDTEGDR